MSAVLPIVLLNFLVDDVSLNPMSVSAAESLSVAHDNYHDMIKRSTYSGIFFQRIQKVVSFKNMSSSGFVLRCLPLEATTGVENLHLLPSGARGGIGASSKSRASSASFPPTSFQGDQSNSILSHPMLCYMVQKESGANIGNRDSDGTEIDLPVGPPGLHLPITGLKQEEVVEESSVGWALCALAAAVKSVKRNSDPSPPKGVDDFID